MCELHLNKVDRKRLWGNKKEQPHPVHTTGAVLGWCLEVTKTDEGLEASQVNSGTRNFHVLLKIETKSLGGGQRDAAGSVFRNSTVQSQGTPEANIGQKQTT